jgi:hypothetical protein
MKTRSGVVDDIFPIDDSMHLLSPIPKVPVAVQGPLHFIQGFDSQVKRRMSGPYKPSNSFFLWLQTKRYPHPGLPLIVCSNTRKSMKDGEKLEMTLDTISKFYNKIVQKLRHP